MLQRGALYIRVSTEEQTEFSPDAQLKALKEYAKKNNILVSENHIFMDEGFSGRKAEKRPAFMEMIKTAKKNPKQFDLILVHKYDRFARSREDSVVYKSLLRKQCNIKVVSITEQMEDDKFSIILESMLEAMAEYYSLNLADEVKKGMQEKAKRGQYAGGTLPLGYKAPIDGKTLLIDEHYKDVIEMIFHKFTVEDCSMLEVAKYLNSLGHKTQNNDHFTKRTIKYILQNPVYCGYNRWNYRKGNASVYNSPEDWIIEKGEHIPLVSKETFDAAQMKLQKVIKQSKPKTRPPSEYKHWLSGILRCASCNSTLTAYKNKGYIHYRCQKALKGGCSTPNYISANKVENAILMQIQKDSENVPKFSFEKIKTKTKDSILEKLQIQLSKIQKKYEIANQALLAEIDTLEEYKIKKRCIQQEEKEILEEIDKIEKETQEKNCSHPIQNQLITAHSLLTSSELDIVEKSKIAKSFIKSIAIHSKEKKLHILYFLDK